MTENDANNELIISEYNNSFQYAKFYDERQTSYLKYATSFGTAIAVAIFSVLKFGVETNSKLTTQALALLLFVAFISLFLIFLSAIRNRIYFVLIMRQINSIRKLITQKNSAFKEYNKGYLDSDFPAFKFLSTQVLVIYGIGFITSIYLSLFSCALTYLIRNDNACSSLIFVSVLFISCVAEYYIIRIQLHHSKDTDADILIHGKKEND